MKDAQYQVEVALRLALVGEDRGAALQSTFSDFTKWLNHYNDVGNQQMWIPLIEVEEWFFRIKSALRYVDLYLPNVRAGWQARAVLLFEKHAVIDEIDSAEVIETLCLLGSEKIMVQEAWGAKSVLEGVRLLLNRVWVDSQKLVDFRVDEKPFWTSDTFDGNWTESTRNADFGYVEVLRAINNPQCSWAAPTDPQGTTALPRYIRYWFCLAAVLVGHLGWRRPAVGLARWINKGMPDDGAVLTQVKHLWGSYAASMMTETGRDILQIMADQVLGYSESSKNQITSFKTNMSPEKLLLQDAIGAKTANDAKWAAPIVGGWDPLHLTTHVASVLGSNSCSSEMDLDKVSILHDDLNLAKVRASLVVESGMPWYAALNREGDRLRQRPDGRSWRVDVVSKNFGYIGEFRKSRVTGLWFSGKHSSHMWGNQG